MPPDGPIRRVLWVRTPDPEVRKEAIEDPGPSWREWFYFEFLKVWLLLGFGILIALVVAAFDAPFNLPLMLLGLAGAVYLEFLLWRYLYYEPNPEKEYLRQGPFTPTWYRPARFGRWTSQAWRHAAGESPFGDAPVGPDPREFL